MTRRDGELALATVRGIAVAHWNPGRRSDRRGRPTRLLHPVRNVGDLLGPVVVRELVAALGLPPAARTRRLLAVGSILHLARDGDVVWGAGAGNKAGTRLDRLPRLDVRCVRGPATVATLERLGETGVRGLGDPVLLLGALRPDLVVPPEARDGVVVVPNLNDLAGTRDDRLLSPREPWSRVIRRIARSSLVVGSSLHGIVIAESLGVAARFVRSGAEGALKYADHYAATGRDSGVEVAASVEEAVERGGAPPPVWDPRPLLAAFPADLWGAAAPDREVLAVLADAAVATLRSAGRFPDGPRTGVTGQGSPRSVGRGARR